MTFAHTATIGTASITFNIDASGDRADLENEGQGNSTFTLTAGDLKRIVPEGFEFVQTSDDSERTTDLREMILDGIDEDLDTMEDDEEVYCTDVDALIVLLALAGERGEALTLDWQSDGSAFWLFHDIEHAIGDASIDMNYTDAGVAFLGPLDGSDESHATVRAALECFRTGAVPAGEVITELVDNAKPFEDRFGYAPDFLDTVLASVEITVKS